MTKLIEDRPEGCVIFQTSWYALLHVTDEQAGKAIKAAAGYFLNGEETAEGDDAVKLLSIMLNSDVSKSLKRYEATCERNRQNRNRARLEGSTELCALPD